MRSSVPFLRPALSQCRYPASPRGCPGVERRAPPRRGLSALSGNAIAWTRHDIVVTPRDSLRHPDRVATSGGTACSLASMPAAVAFAGPLRGRSRGGSVGVRLYQPGCAPTPGVAWGDSVGRVRALRCIRAPGLYGSTSFQLPCDGRPRGALLSPSGLGAGAPPWPLGVHHGPCSRCPSFPAAHLAGPVCLRGLRGPVGNRRRHAQDWARPHSAPRHRCAGVDADVSRRRRDMGVRRGGDPCNSASASRAGRSSAPSATETASGASLRCAASAAPT